MPLIIKTLLSYLVLFIYKISTFFVLLKITKKQSVKPFVLSVGNLSLGGSGKTPMIEKLAKECLKQNLAPAIISRGYKRNSSQLTVVSDGKGILAPCKKSGDEPYMLAQSLPKIPIIVGKKNKALISVSQKFKPSVILVDDSFQTRTIAKNLDIVLVDVSVHINKYQLFPLGFLREPIKAIRRANVVVFTKCNFDSNYKKNIQNLFLKSFKKSKINFFEANYISSFKKYSFNNKVFKKNTTKLRGPILALSGIANDHIFKLEIKKYCLKSAEIKILTYKDHHSYSSVDIDNIKKLSQKIKTKTIITTKKDFFKLYKGLYKYNIYIIDIKHQIVEEDRFFSLINKKIIDYLS